MEHVTIFFSAGDLYRSLLKANLPPCQSPTNKSKVASDFLQYRQNTDKIESKFSEKQRIKKSTNIFLDQILKSKKKNI